MIKDVQKQVNLCLTMLENIDRAGKELHELKIDNHYFWQEIYHALMGSYFWFRLKKMCSKRLMTNPSIILNWNPQQKNTWTDMHSIVFSRTSKNGSKPSSTMKTIGSKDRT